MSIETEFSDENVMHYAKACFEIADSLVTRSKQGDFNTLLIPSRGAVPLFIGSMYALQCLSQEHEEHRTFLGRIRAPNLIREYIMPSYALPPIKEQDKKVNILLCPFTADINMQPYAENAKLEGEISVEEFVNDTRKYWTKVVHALTEGKKERDKNPYLQFYLYLLRNVENRHQLSDEYEGAARVEGLAMIDTVISGRASTTIIDGFKEEKITPYSLLVIDNEEKSLKEPYAVKIRSGEAYGNVKSIPIPRIFSEDKGASLEGVVGIVYPSLMFNANWLELRKKSFFPVGAGSWYPLPQNDPHESAFRKFCSMLKSAVNIECAEFCDEGIDKTKEEDLMGESRKRLLEILKSEKLLVPNHYSASYIRFRYRPSKRYETSSHVLHVCFPEEVSKNITNNFKREFESRQ